MEEIKLTIDGKEVTGEKGDTILKVCEENGIYVPTLCHHERLPDVGACRMCIVEIKDVKDLKPACVTPAEDGMVVTTDNEEIHTVRKMNLEFLLAEHPNDCMTCGSYGQCELQELIYKFGIEKPLFEKSRFDQEIDRSSPVIIIDRNKCILCGRCVRACNEVQVNNILDFRDRGYDRKVIAGFDSPLAESLCYSCGECVSVCPVGALTEKMPRFKALPWELETKRTICPHCAVGCTIDVKVKDGAIVKIESPGADIGTNNGSLCVKGRFGYDFVHSEARLTTPLIKENGEFREASWDDALSLVVDKFRSIKNEYGSDAFAALAPGKSTNEANYLLQKFTRAVIGTNNLDFCTRMCHTPTGAALGAAFGGGAMTNSMSEIEGADAIFVIGTNITETFPIMGNAVKRTASFSDAKLIVADPRKIDMAKFADVYLRLRHGTDVALLNGMMNVIINEDWHDKEFIQERTEGFEELKKGVEKYTPEFAEEITGVSASDIREAARLYAKADRAMILFDMGITQHITGINNVRSLANLALLTGNVGQESTGVNSLRGQTNGEGAGDMGVLPNVYPGNQKVTDEAARQKFEAAWGVELPKEVGLSLMAMVEAAHAGELKAMYIMGMNPVMSAPDITHVRAGLAKLDFLVVQDIFLSETAELADVVLPAASHFEKDGTVTNVERRVQRVHKVIDPVGESRSDWEVICEIATRMGYEMKYESPAQVMDEISSLTPIYGGISYDRLENGGIQWPCPDKEHPGTQYLFKDKFPIGLGKFQAIEYIPPNELPDEEYPFVLSTGRTLYHWHTGTITRRAKALDAIVPKGYVEINPEDAESLSVSDGEEVKVASRRGEITISAKVSDIVPEGTVFIPFPFRESAANVLTNPELNPQAKNAALKVCAVNISPLKIEE